MKSVKHHNVVITKANVIANKRGMTQAGLNISLVKGIKVLWKAKGDKVAVFSSPMEGDQRLLGTLA
jgi:hypothetical protein